MVICLWALPTAMINIIRAAIDIDPNYLINDSNHLKLTQLLRTAVQIFKCLVILMHPSVQNT